MRKAASTGVKREENMYYLSEKDHKMTVRRVHWFYLKVVVFLIVLFVASLYIPMHYKFEGDVLSSVVETFRSEYMVIKIKEEMLSLLRTKPLTVAQALDISEAVLKQQNVPVPIVLAVIKQESQFTTTAVSNKGAKGLMQIMPNTWKIFTNADYKQVHDPIQNIDVGTRFLADLYKQYGDWRMVFRAYFAGPENAKNPKYDWYANAVLKKAEEFQRAN
jgi:soluble lytic murein transglycosylase-like protein